MAFLVGLQRRCWSERGTEMDASSGGPSIIRLVLAASSGDMRKREKEAATSSVNSPRLQCSSARIHAYERSNAIEESLASCHVISMTFWRTSPLCMYDERSMYKITSTPQDSILDLAPPMSFAHTPLFAPATVACIIDCS